MVAQTIRPGYISTEGSANGQVLMSNGIITYWASTSGLTGYTGSKGADGTIGYDGSVGYTGSIGATGFTGSVGYVGSKGDLGYVGSQGPQGSFGGAAFDYTFNANTNNSDPTNGNLKLSNTDLTLANTLYISENADNFQSIYTFLQTIDDSTSAIKGHFTVTEKANTANFVLYAITGSHAHYTNYFAVPSSYLNGSANNFTNNLDIIITFARTGDIGDTGFTGSTGYVGSKGELGYTGSKGDLGYTGSSGATGFTGSVGFVGSKGDLGYTGSFGSTGYVGSKGDTSTANATSQYFISNGSNTTYTLLQTINNSNNVLVVMDGLVQIPNIDYTIANTTLTLSQAAPQYSSIEIRNLENGTGVAGGSSGDSNRGYLLSMVFNI